MAQSLKISTQGAGTPIVLLHGWGLNSGVWQPLVTQLAENFKVISVDLPGFGINHDVLPAKYTIDEVASLIVDAVAQPAIYLGWSLGGQVATQIALSYPQQVHALITVASSPCFLQQEGWPGINHSVLDSFHHQLTKDVKATLDGFLKIQAMGSPHIRHDIKQIKELVMAFPLPSKDALSSALDLLRDVDLRAQLGSLTMPFLRIYGRLDSLVPKSIDKLVEQLVPHSEAIMFERASHAPFISHFEEFNLQLSQWLSTVKI